MFNSLRSRLLLSFLVIIAVSLSVVALALLALSVSQNSRLLPTLRQLNAIGQGMRRELIRIGEFVRTDLASVQELLQDVSIDQNVRITIINRRNGRVLYDSAKDESAWTRIQAGDVDRPRGEFLNVDPGFPVGRYQSPDGERWLVYSQPLTVRSKISSSLSLDALNPRLYAISERPSYAPFFRQALSPSWHPYSRRC